MVSRRWALRTRRHPSAAPQRVRGQPLRHHGIVCGRLRGALPRMCLRSGGVVSRGAAAAAPPPSCAAAKLRVVWPTGRLPHPLSPMFPWLPACAAPQRPHPAAERGSPALCSLDRPGGAASPRAAAPAARPQQPQPAGRLSPPAGAASSGPALGPHTPPMAEDLAAQSSADIAAWLGGWAWLGGGDAELPMRSGPPPPRTIRQRQPPRQPGAAAAAAVAAAPGRPPAAAPAPGAPRLPAPAGSSGAGAGAPPLAPCHDAQPLGSKRRWVGWPGWRPWVAALGGCPALPCPAARRPSHAWLHGSKAGTGAASA